MGSWGGIKHWSQTSTQREKVNKCVARVNPQSAETRSNKEFLRYPHVHNKPIKITRGGYRNISNLKNTHSPSHPSFDPRQRRTTSHQPPIQSQSPSPSPKPQQPQEPKDDNKPNTQHPLPIPKHQHSWGVPQCQSDIDATTVTTEGMVYNIHHHTPSRHRQRLWRMYIWWWCELVFDIAGL